MPPYFKQSNKHACSLAVLRSVLATHNIEVSEEELIDNIKKDYGLNFKNIWNATIARIAREYGIDSHMYALWPLFKPKILTQALREYTVSPDKLDIYKYENPNDKDELNEPLQVAYKDMFKAIRLGCKVTYGSLTERRLKLLLNSGYQIQTSIRNNVLYKNESNTFHSLLLYKLDKDMVTYHDPAKSAAMSCSIPQLLRSASSAGAFIAFKI